MELTLGKRIVQKRKQLGMTQDALAERLGVTPQAVSKWENDQSCPDITMLPRLAKIFNTTTDALLGIAKEIPVQEATVIHQDEAESEGLHFRNGNWEFKYNKNRSHNIMLAMTILLIGILYLTSSLLKLDAGFWDIAWPSGLLVFGLFGLYPKLSIFRLAMALIGGYFLIDNLFPLPFGLDNGAFFAVALLIFGVAMLVKAVRQPKKPTYSFTYHTPSGSNPTREFRIDGDYFGFNGSFGDQDQTVEMPLLAKGEINTSFGDFTVDLQKVEALAPGCEVDANMSFGDLRILVPRKYQVSCVSSASFASVEFEGHHDDEPAGVIRLNTNVSFGEVTVEYI